MTPTYTQAGRQLTIETPLGPDTLLLTALRGHEAISEPFSYELELLAERGAEVPFDRILGQETTVTMKAAFGEKRYFSGLVKAFAQCGRDETFVKFRAEVVPKFWLLQKQVRSRIFQTLSVPDILRQVLAGLEVKYDLLADYYERDYCVQYRESDFDFASRLMEEEGIYYFFTHSQNGHQMVLSDKGNGHPDVPGDSSILFEPASGGMREEMCVKAWEKRQELRSTEYTVWDHHFELPGYHLDDTVGSVGSVKVGEVTHQLNLAAGDRSLEIYDYPGGYARRFDAVDPGGSDRPRDITHLFLDRNRIARVRMEEEEAASLAIAGGGDCANFTAGHRFTLREHFDADGGYLLTGVEHDARMGGFRSGEQESFHYENRFTCIPEDLTYRPRRVTPRPVIAGPQTATVVGPKDDKAGEILCDKYGRVKVQFHWDREGKLDADSSCWVRVAQLWAGKGWGAFFWPRRGHEVVVAFEDGDPDQPLIVGSVYNAANMPPYTLPKHDQYGGIRSASVRGTASKHFNGIVFNDALGYEHLSIHSERNMSLNTEFDKMFHAGRNKGERVAGVGVYTVGSLSGGGGSGGGFDDGHTIPHPPPMANVGLNSATVYGDNMSSVAGLNFAMAVGNNVQLVLNPAGLLAGADWVPKILTPVLGSGLGGNLTFVMGTNSTLAIGQAFDLNLGPEKIEVKAGYHDDVYGIVTCILAVILLVVSTIYLVAYALLGLLDADDAARAGLAVFYQGVVDALLAVMISCAAWKKTEKGRGTQEFQSKLFDAVWHLGFKDKAAFKDLAWLAGGSAAAVLGGGVVLGNVLGPLAAAGIAEAIPAPGGTDDSDEIETDSDADADSTSGTDTTGAGSDSGANGNQGGGSGGGPDSHDHHEDITGTYSIQANQVELLSRPPWPPATPVPCVITVLATGEGTDGRVEVRGSQGVRITTGPPLLPPTTSESTNGVEIVVSEAQNVTIQRGLLPVDQKIEMTPEGITIDAGVGTLTLKSLTQITLSVAEGLSTITLGPAGIKIQGVLVQIN